MLEGNRKQVLKLRKELKKRLRNDGITTKEVLPEVKKTRKPRLKTEEIKEEIKEEVKIEEVKKEINKPVRRKRK